MKRSFWIFPLLFLTNPYVEMAEKLKKDLPSYFTVVVSPPFVVVGDEPEGIVKQRVKHTVEWAVKHLKKLYKFRNPKGVIRIYLFKDKKSYQYHTKHLFGKTPKTPFGFYLSSEKTIVTNIATGEGTLVHEIVHPFLEENFPKCPPWLNEGLASLYEQCGEKQGRIWGYTNWRLSALQRAIRQGSLPSLLSMMKASQEEFYGENSSLYYAQARYLLYYLQQQGKLTVFYHSFLKHREKDPFGIKTLQKVLSFSSYEEFQKEWETFVLKLRYPPSR